MRLRKCLATKRPDIRPVLRSRAEDEIRTRDLLLGKRLVANAKKNPGSQTKISHCTTNIWFHIASSEQRRLAIVFQETYDRNAR